jgi:recombination protein RecR
MADASPRASLDELVQRLSRLPGIGKRSAERIAFYLLKQPTAEAMELARSIADLKNRTRHCSTCFNLTDADPCSICIDTRRDQSLVLVVEQPGDLVRIESTGLHKGVYHVLMGRLAPLDGVGPGDINVAALVQRVEAGGVREVILGMNPTFEGDGTTLYLADRLGKLGVKVTRLARGLPTGANLEVASKAVLADALAGRQKME